VRVHGLDNKIYHGVASVGYRPTFHGKQIILEVFIFDFDAMIYGKKITVEFLKKIRDEEHFDSIPELVVQIEKDVECAKAYFKDKKQ
jgi:riboflavin kinase/FMN adenylyltransferase